LIPVFLCYRRTDGIRTAKWLYKHLHGKTVEGLGVGASIHVYFDVETPSVPDWTQIHRPSLEGSRAFIFLATPGAFAPGGPEDWVHAELTWWLRNRKSPPIVIETTGDGMRWVPKAVTKKWPNIQRIELILEHVERLPEDNRGSETERLISLLCSSLTEVVPRVTFEQVYRLRTLTRRSKGLIICALLLAVTASFLFWDGNKLKHARAVLEQESARLRRENAQLATLSKQQELGLRASNLSVERPPAPIIQLSDDNGFAFILGSATVSPRFAEKLRTVVAPLLAEQSERTGANVIEVIGHTDPTRIYGRQSNVDEVLGNKLSAERLSQAVAGSNVDLAMLRAVSVASVLNEILEEGRLGSVKRIVPYSAGSISASDTPSKERNRRVEIRLSSK
jgi:flagellar motor protein MotB